MVTKDPVTDFEQDNEQTDDHIFTYLRFISGNKNLTQGKAQSQVFSLPYIQFAWIQLRQLWETMHIPWAIFEHMLFVRLEEVFNESIISLNLDILGGLMDSWVEL